MPSAPSPRRKSKDLGFRAGTGFFAALVVLLVAGIAFVLWRESRLSIAKFGFSFWKTKTWDPVSGDFGALPFIWGTLYSSFIALLISTRSGSRSSCRSSRRGSSGRRSPS